MSEQPSSRDLEDHAILVTGSTRGIGHAVAQHLVARGAIVGVHGRSAEVSANVARDLGEDRAVALAADLDDPEQAAGLVEHFVETTGRLDGLVNNAGAGRAVSFRGLDIDSWRQTFRVNLESAMLLSQAAFHRLRKQRSGAIVNVASISAHGPGGWMGPTTQRRKLRS